MDDDSAEEGLQPSKSAVKREMTALQKLGEELAGLSERELARIPIEEERVLEVIRESQNIRSNSARKRHFQYLGKLMRSIDADPIRRALDVLHQRRRGEANAFHELEHWRDLLLSDGVSAIDQLLQKYPQADRQHLRQLIRQQQREASSGKPPAAARKLFKYLRELAELE
ncbi:MAG: ribosome biogenesis factor YjgA [Halieaceae bacterium]